MSKIEAKTYATKDGGSVEIRSAVPEDAPNLLAFIRATIPHSPLIASTLEDFTITEEEECEFLENTCDAERDVYLLAIDGEEIVGSMDFGAGRRVRERHQGVMGMMVGQTHRGRGIGELMLRALIEWATEHQVIERIELSVLRSNKPARRLYEKLGFVEEGRRYRSFQMSPGVFEDAIQMYLFV